MSRGSKAFSGDSTSFESGEESSESSSENLSTSKFSGSLPSKSGSTSNGIVQSENEKKWMAKASEFTSSEKPFVVKKKYKSVRKLASVNGRFAYRYTVLRRRVDGNADAIKDWELDPQQ